MHQAAEPVLTFEQCRHLRLHVSEMWPRLTRSIRHAVEAAQDPKVGAVAPGSHRWPLYISARENPKAIRHRLELSLSPAACELLEVRVLPGEPLEITEHGLLYLPDRYVVPGGRFNEMYGWDSYFIALGLLRDGRAGLARSMTDQCLYEVEHYGAVLNANRTYCIARSHPPFLGRMVLEVFEEERDEVWLQRALPLVERYHAFWMVHPHFLPSLGLSRYHAFGRGPAPEVVSSETDEMGRTHYDRLLAFFREQPEALPWEGPYYHRQEERLRSAAYAGDRTVRESGFDLTNRFGFCGLEAVHYVPVCLNTLLWRQEKDIALIHQALDPRSPAARGWNLAAESRREMIRDFLWDEADGLFYDWHLAHNKRMRYPFATTFWPLWAGLATPEQAARVAGNVGLFRAPGGLLTSTEDTGCQWDAPMTWAPLVLLAVEGLRRYGHQEPAVEIARAFVSMAAREFERTGMIFEKYNAVEASNNTSPHVDYGYPTNEPGFGWTNACLVRLMDFLGCE